MFRFNVEQERLQSDCPNLHGYFNLLHDEPAVCIGGEGGIRTHGNVNATPDFESGTFDHSATSPVGAHSTSNLQFFRAECSHAELDSKD